MAKMPPSSEIATRSSLETTERTIWPSESLLNVFSSYIGFVWVLSSTRESKHELLVKYAKKEGNCKVCTANLHSLRCQSWVSGDIATHSIQGHEKWRENLID